MKKYLVICLILFIFYYYCPNNNVDNSVVTNNLVTVSYNNDTFDITLDDYVLHVLACEMPALFNDEALKAGAIAIRTYYSYKKNHNDNYIALTTDQCYLSDDELKNKWGSYYDNYILKLSNIISETSDYYITYDNEYILSLYYSLSNGYTENCSNVFGKEYPYLVSSPSLWDKNVKGYEKTTEITKNVFLEKLGISGDIIISNIERNSLNRVSSITINGQIISGVSFRKLLDLRSTDFDIDVNDECVIITTRGYGHGVGMSQYGANEMAKMGYNYEDILKYYYKNTEIKKLYV